MTKSTDNRAAAILSPDNIRKSFFYIGSGFDLQPFLRFSHLTDTYFYVDMESAYCDKSKIMERFQAAVDKLPANNMLETVEAPEKISIAQLHRSVNMVHFEDYLSLFHHCISQYPPPEYMWQMTLNRKFSNFCRKIKLFLIPSEGFFFYLLATDNGKHAPQFVCTLPGSTGLDIHKLDSLFDYCRSAPDYWIQGDVCWDEIYENCNFMYKNLKYSQVIYEFRKWSAQYPVNMVKVAVNPYHFFAHPHMFNITFEPHGNMSH